MPNKALKVCSSLRFVTDSFSLGMLRILCPAFHCPLALLHGLLPIAQVLNNVQRKNDCGSTYGLNVLAHWP